MSTNALIQRKCAPFKCIHDCMEHFLEKCESLVWFKLCLYTENYANGRNSAEQVVKRKESLLLPIHKTITKGQIQGEEQCRSLITATNNYRYLQYENIRCAACL